jgi:aspartyl-tRNA(Asn)/glutamyl-tRNA(Gln) amidotransferase subunit A
MVESNEITVLENHLQIGNFGGFPSITIPNGMIDSLPVGINITSNCYEDQKVLNIAKALEDEMDYKNMIAGVKYE